MSREHEMCAACLHSSRAHATVGKRTCCNEGCSCPGFAKGAAPAAEPEPVTPAEHGAVEKMAEEIFLRMAAVGNDVPEAIEFAWKAAEAFVLSRRARPKWSVAPRGRR